MQFRTLLMLACVPALLALVSACSSLRALDAITPRSGYMLHSDLAYGGASRQRLDVYVPNASARPPAGWPVVVFFYGGNWREGERRDYRFVAQALAERGVLVVLPDYRLYPEVGYSGILQDSAAAVAWALRQAAQYGGNPDRVMVAGHSAGAYNAAMVALDARWLAAQGFSPRRLVGLIGLAGPYDFVPIENPAVIPVFGGTTPPPDSQPIFHVRPGTQLPAALLLAPARDSLVDPQRNTEGLARVWRAAGGQVEVHRHESLSHATTVATFAWPLRGLAPVLDQVSAFALQTGPGASAPGASAQLRQR